MEDVEKLIKTSVGEIEKVLSAKTVVGEPMTFEGKTIIPLISIGFGFGAGGGMGKGEDKQSGEGAAGGSGGGAGVRPVAVIVIDKAGVRIEPIKGGIAAALEKVGDAIVKAVEKRGEKKEET